MFFDIPTILPSIVTFSFINLLLKMFAPYFNYIKVQGPSLLLSHGGQVMGDFILRFVYFDSTAYEPRFRANTSK